MKNKTKILSLLFNLNFKIVSLIILKIYDSLTDSIRLVWSNCTLRQDFIFITTLLFTVCVIQINSVIFIHLRKVWRNLSANIFLASTLRTFHAFLIPPT